MTDDLRRAIAGWIREAKEKGLGADELEGYLERMSMEWSLTKEQSDEQVKELERIHKLQADH